MGRSLGIDLGSKRVGIALSDKLNIIASPFKTLFFINQEDLLSQLGELINKFDVKTNSTSSVASSLSGGNLQKFVIGRELLQNPKLLIINQPTWGVDASAAAFIRQAIIDLAESGTAVVIISQDLDELIEISDSFTALVGGRISDPKPMNSLNIRDIGQMMSGAMSYD